MHLHHLHHLSQCVVMSSVTSVSLRRLCQRFAAHRAAAAASASSPDATTATSSPTSTATATDADASAAAAAAAADGAWVCPTPEQLHAELAARWHALYSLAARAGAWRRSRVERS